MKDDINSDYIANKIRMLGSDYPKIAIIVEGRSDKLLYERIFNSECCEFVVSLGKKNAVDAIKKLNQDKTIKRVLTIVDADFDRLEQRNQATPNLLLTDDHDLEMMIIKSSALEKVLKERGSEDKLKISMDEVRLILLAAGKKIGYLRWLSLRENLSLKFEDLTYSKFIDQQTLVIDISTLVKTVKDRSPKDHSQKPHLKDSEIKTKIEDLENISQDTLQICCGHDLVAILSIALYKKWGTWNSKEVTPEILERELRLAYEKIFFESTNLAKMIQDWEKQNGTKIL